MSLQILVADRVHPILLEKLESAGFEMIYRPEISYGDFQALLPQLWGVVINSRSPMRAEQIRKADQLKVIGRLGSGLDIIDLEAAEARGVRVFSAPEGNRNAVAEHVLGMLLGLLHQIPMGDAELRKDVWRREARRGRELAGRTIGVIGYGHTGSRFVRKLAGLDVKVLIFDKYKQRFAEELRYAHECSLKELKAESDIISLHLPLDEGTKGMVDRQFLQECRHGIILINSSRGGICRTEDLVYGLEEGMIGGLCLDVFENENVSQRTKEEQKMYGMLSECERAVLTPHIAGWTEESLKKIAEVLATKILNSTNEDGKNKI